MVTNYYFIHDWTCSMQMHSANSLMSLRQIGANLSIISKFNWLKISTHTVIYFGVLGSSESYKVTLYLTFIKFSNKHTFILISQPMADEWPTPLYKMDPFIRHFIEGGHKLFSQILISAFSQYLPQMVIR